MKAHQKSIGKNDEWLTPPEIIAALGQFDLDPCSPAVRPWPTAKLHYWQGGLDLPWEGRIWCNPPFNRNSRPTWMEKMANHGNGVMLIPAATETVAFDRYVWNMADAVCFVKGRPHFHHVTGAKGKENCGTAIALVAYGQTNVDSLYIANLGKTITLNSP